MGTQILRDKQLDSFLDMEMDFFSEYGPNSPLLNDIRIETFTRTRVGQLYVPSADTFMPCEFDGSDQCNRHCPYKFMENIVKSIPRKDLRLVPMRQTEAIEFTAMHHRTHKKKLQGSICQVGVAAYDMLLGVAIAGRPSSRVLEKKEPLTLQISRSCVFPDVHNANSMLMGAICKAAANLGYTSVITYTLDSESGVSLKATGFKAESVSDGGSWDCDSRPRKQEDHPTEPKVRWRRNL